MSRRSTWVYDDLLNYVASPLFQVPVITFMENNCIVFEPSLEDCREYRELHGAYCALVTVLLDAFRQDTGLSHEDVIGAMTKMSQTQDIREVFAGVFELILATESFRLFCRLMIQKNLELQQQALLLIMKQFGHIPEIMQTNKKDESHSETESQSPSSAPANTSMKKQEEEIMESIIKATTVSKAKPEETEITKAVEAESQLLKIETQREQQKLEQELKNLTFEEGPVGDAPKKASLPRLMPQAPPATPVEQEKTKGSSLVGLKSPKAANSGDAVAMWMEEAKKHSNEAASAALQSAAATLANLSPDELKKRQEYLKEQRDKLMAMKKKEREKQLTVYEEKSPSRPKSARTARSMLSRPPSEPMDEKPKDVDGKTLEMRRSIANRLKSEVLGKKNSL